MNMLSAKKVRLHGMQSSRWTTRDKLTQYKGLINLYTRDRKILSFDAAVTRKKQAKEIKQLRRDIKSNRADLDNAVQGDRQQLRNTLAEHRDLQLGFQNLPPIRVMDHLHQGNFNKRKLLDRMDYKMKQKTQTLINLKLELAELEDQLKFEGKGVLPVEQEAQLITGKVQDATLKKEAALSVRHTYRNILKILKKDAIYFDAVLATLKLDGFLQSKCMMKTTELGQLATEYLDDRKQEFKELERAVKRDMKARELSLKVVREEVQDLTNNMGLLIRRDSDINLGKVIIPLNNADVQLQQDIVSIERILRELQEMTCVSNFDSIFPCLVEQQRQTKRLKGLLEKCISDRDNLANKKKHADKMHISLLYTMNETTQDYQIEKAQLLEEIQNQTKRKEELEKVRIHQCELLVKVRSSLHQLSQKCLIVKQPEPKSNRPATTTKVPVKERETKVAIKAADVRRRASSVILPPPSFEQDGLKIIQQLEPKLTLLMSNAQALALQEDKKEQAYKLFHQLTSETCAQIPYDVIELEDSLFVDVVLEDPNIPTYFDIKAKSKELVELCTIDEDAIPMFTVKKKKFKFK